MREELRDVVHDALIGSCVDDGLAWCDSARLHCPVLVENGAVVLEPNDEGALDVVFLAVRDGSITSAELEHDRLANG